MKFIDLRSDTVTKPSPGMRRAIAEAEVGDDVFHDDPTVIRLEARVAALFNKEASLFVPSGTMGNQVALKTVSEPGWELVCERECHIVNYEVGGPAAHSSLMINLITTDYGFISADQVEAAVRYKDIHCPLTKIVALENTHNRQGGTIYPLDEIKKIRQVANKYNLFLHLDGARIWNASIASGISLAEWAQPFDTISACLSKGLGAPVGSMIIGSKDFIEKARRVRKLFGGAMRQVGILAAAGLYALEHNLVRLAEDHYHAHLLAEGLKGTNGLEVDLSRVQTNIVLVDVSQTGVDSQAAAQKLADAGILCVPFGKTSIRFVTHLDVTLEECREAVRLAAQIKWK